jgi:hypothetical protein
MDLGSVALATGPKDFWKPFHDMNRRTSERSLGGLKPVSAAGRTQQVATDHLDIVWRTGQGAEV